MWSRLSSFEECIIRFHRERGEIVAVLQGSRCRGLFRVVKIDSCVFILKLFIFNTLNILARQNMRNVVYR